MEIILKFNKKIEEDDELQLQSSQISLACGYSFHHQQKIQVRYSSSTQSYITQNVNYMQQINQAYQSHKIDLAFDLVKKYEADKCYSQKQQSLQNRKLMIQIKEQMKDVLNFEKQFCPQGWKQKKKKQKYKISTKQFESSVGVLIQADLDLPIQKFLFIINQTDLMKDFMPFMVHSKEVKTIARNNKIGHVISDFPILSQREAFFQGMGYDRVGHNKTILLCSRSLHNRKDLQQKFGYQVVTTKGAVQLEYKFFLIQYEPYTKQKGHIKLAMNIDMQLSLPMFIMDPIAQNFGKDFFKSLLKIAKNFQGSEWEKRAQQKKQFCQFIKSTISQYFLYSQKSIKQLQAMKEYNDE